MGKSVRKTVIIVALVVLMVLLWAASASAYSVSNKQLTPGFTTRTIWDSAQVAVYKLPDGVNHNGAMHFELRWKPTWADLDVYLLDRDWVALNEEQGYMATFTGREVIDYRVTNVFNRTIETDPYSGEQHMVGDVYYVVVVAFNDVAQFQLWGYYPQIDLEVGTSTTNQWNYYMQPWRMPAKSSEYKKIAGAIYGYPYDFRPTSEGNGRCELEWPADIANKTVSNDHALGLMPSNLEQYVYAGANWDTVFENYGDQNWTPGALGGGRFGLGNGFAVTEGEFAAPQVMLHYIPSVYLISSDKTQGPFVEPKLGINREYFKATITYPENLRLTSIPAKVKKGTKATMKGTFALNGVWVPAGVQVTIQRKGSSGWTKVKTVSVGADGKWTAKFTVNTGAKYRAKATGDDATGLATEYSIAKKISVYR